MQVSTHYHIFETLGIEIALASGFFSPSPYSVRAEEPYSQTATKKITLQYFTNLIFSRAQTHHHKRREPRRLRIKYEEALIINRRY